jgi:hypothetical protein
LVEHKIKEKRWRGLLKQHSETVQAKIAKRAAAILSGAKRKARKDYTEGHASEIAAELQKEWFSWKGKTGRPLGKHTDSFLSLEEMVAVLLPIIEEEANKKLKIPVVSELISEIQPASFAALVAAIKIERRGTLCESVARSVARVRRKMREPKPNDVRVSES